MKTSQKPSLGRLDLNSLFKTPRKKSYYTRNRIPEPTIRILEPAPAPAKPVQTAAKTQQAPAKPTQPPVTPGMISVSKADYDRMVTELSTLRTQATQKAETQSEVTALKAEVERLTKQLVKQTVVGTPAAAPAKPVVKRDALGCTVKDGPSLTPSQRTGIYI